MGRTSKLLIWTVISAGVFALVSGGAAVAHDHHPDAGAATSKGAGEAAAAAAAERPFLAENDAAMTRMMADMAITPTGDVERDFVAMMVPHHQGAMDMAAAVLRHGHNETLRRLAQEIIVTQQQEIAAMRLATGQKLPPSVPSPTQIQPVDMTSSLNPGQ